MWIIANYHAKEFSLFKDKLSKAIDNLSFYRPCYRKDKKIIPLLGNYCFLKHDNFQDENFLQKLKYTQGLNYFLKNCKINQREIVEFIGEIKSNEENKEIVSPDFLLSFVKNKGVFLSGFFKNIQFDLINLRKKDLTVSIKDCPFPITINKLKASINFL